MTSLSLVRVDLKRTDLYCPRCDKRYDYDEKDHLPRRSPCSHVVCSSCLTEVTNCPVCEAEIDAGETCITDVYRLELSRSVMNLVDTDVSQFEDWKVIDGGSYGVVYKVKHKVDMCEYAIKRVKMPPASFSKRTLAEVKKMSQLRHENIVVYRSAWLGQELVSETMYCGNDGTTLVPVSDSPTPERLVVDKSTNRPVTNSSRDEKTPADHIRRDDNNSAKKMTKEQLQPFLYIQMELCEKNLKHCIAEGLHRDENRIWKILEGIARGLKYIHDKGIIHRDLKPGNILLDANDQVRIADFGISRSQIAYTEMGVPSGDASEMRMTLDKGTEGFIAPEVQKTNHYTTKADMYSLGVVLLMMVTVPGKGFQVLQQIRASESNETILSILNVMTYTDVHIIAWLVQDNATYRPDCEQLLTAIEEVVRYGEKMSKDVKVEFRTDIDSVQNLLKRTVKTQPTAEKFPQKVAALLNMDQSEADWLKIDQSRADHDMIMYVMEDVHRILDTLKMNVHDVRETICLFIQAKLGLPMEMNLSVMCATYPMITECTKTGNLYCYQFPHHLPQSQMIIKRFTSLWVHNYLLQLNYPESITLLSRYGNLTRLVFVNEHYMYIVAGDRKKVGLVTKYDLRHTETFTDGRRHLEPLTEKLLHLGIGLASTYSHKFFAVNVDPSNREEKLIYIVMVDNWGARWPPMSPLALSAFTLDKSPLVVHTFTLDGDDRRSITLSWPRRPIWKFLSDEKRRITDFTVNSRGEIFITTSELLDVGYVANVHLFNVNGEYERVIAQFGSLCGSSLTIHVDRRDYLYYIREEKLCGRTLRTIDILDPSYKLIGRIRLHKEKSHDYNYIKLVQRNGDIVLTKHNLDQGNKFFCILKNPFYK